MYVSQEAEILGVHSLLTIQDTEAIKRNSRNVRKRRVFAQRVTFIMGKKLAYHPALHTSASNFYKEVYDAAQV